VTYFRQESGATFGLVYQVLDQACCGDIVAPIAEFMRRAGIVRSAAAEI
jgi:hypothetical protein